MGIRIIALTATATAAVACMGCASSVPSHVANAPMENTCAGVTDAASQQLANNFYAPSHLLGVAPVYKEDTRAAAPNTRAGVAMRPRYLAGASFYVAAEKGFNAPYLQRVLQCHAADRMAKAAHPNDPLLVQGIDRVDVAEKGATFRIAVTSGDPHAGRAIWDRAHALEGAGDVQVRQL